MSALRVWLMCLTPLVAALTTTTTTLTAYDGIRYLVPHIEVARISGFRSDEELTPFAVVSATNLTSTADSIGKQLEIYETEDDVFSDFFSQVVYAQGAEHGQLLSGTFNGTILPSGRFPASAELAPGPYFLSSKGVVYRAYRLYDDPYSAFTTGLIPLPNNTFDEVSAASLSAQAEAAVPVPSRLYFSVSDAKPLAGVRVAVKDVYHVKGVKTGAASRDYYALYPTRDESAPSIRRLVDLGAVVVGKAKTSQFANGENPTADWVEVLAPFNPRGDGWQYCSSSSAGSAVAIAAYPWVDAAVGTDTSGSMRFPAAYNGVFAGRQSHGGLATDGLVPVSTTLDTLGVFTRGATSHMNFVRHWYGEDAYPSHARFPKKIYRATNTSMGGFPVAVDAAQALYDSFIDRLTAFLGATTTDLEPSALWRATGPVDRELLAYTDMSYLAVAWHEQVELLQKPFYADWRRAFAGGDGETVRTPRVGPKARASFDYGNGNVTRRRYEEALAVKANFTAWWSGTVNPAHERTCSEAVYVYPTGSKGAPTYRDTYLSPPDVVVNWQISHAAVYAGLPDYAVPIGQVEYLSRLTGVNETLPVSISIGAARGCDWMLARLLTELEAAGVTSAVKTGERAF